MGVEGDSADDRGDEPRVGNTVPHSPNGMLVPTASGWCDLQLRPFITGYVGPSHDVMSFVRYCLLLHHARSSSGVQLNIAVGGG